MSNFNRSLSAILFMVLLSVSSALAGTLPLTLRSVVINNKATDAIFSLNPNEAGDVSFLKNGVTHFPTATGVKAFPANALVFNNGTIYLEGAGTNKVSAAKSNPASTTNLNKSGASQAVLSCVSDTAALLGSGLSNYGPNVYKLDNSAGTDYAYVASTLSTANSNTVPHSYQVFARGSGTLRVGNSVDPLTPSPVALTGRYTQIKLENNLSSSAGNFCLVANAGTVVYFTLIDAEEGPVCTSPIPGSTGTTSRTTAGSDTSGNGLQVSLTDPMLSSLNSGVLNLFQWVELPCAAGSLQNSATLPILSVTNSYQSLLYFARPASGATINLSSFDGTNTATLSGLTLPSGRYCCLLQATRTQFRVGIYAATTHSISYGSWTTYKGSFAVHASNKLRWGCGLGGTPIGIGPFGWYDSDPVALSPLVPDICEELYSNY